MIKYLLLFYYNMNLNLVPIFICLLPLSIFCVDQGSTKISTERNQLRVTLCDYYSANFTAAERAKMQPLIQQYTYLSNQQIQSMLFDLDFSGPAIQTILMVLPHCIALVVLLVIWPCECCCCAWPEKYPVCKKCKKPQKQMYTKVELKWPAYATILCYIVMIIGASAALSGGPEITKNLNNVGCKITSVADDTLYGRISPTDDSVFFVGIGPLKKELTEFNSKLNTFFSQSGTSLNSGPTIRAKQVAIESQISSEYSTYTDITYNQAFRQADGLTYSPTDSKFKTMFYGPETNSSKILGNIRSQLETLFTEVNKALDPMISAWQVLTNDGEPTVSTKIAATTSNINSHEIQLNATIESYQYFNMPTVLNSTNIGLKLLYGLILGLAILGALAAVILTCCTVVRVRLIIYCTCSFLVFLGVISFVLLIFFGVLMPNVSQLCAYVDRQLSTEAGLISLFQKLQFNSSATLYKNCYGSSQSGNIVEQLNPTFSDDFDSIVLLADYTLKFNDLVPNFQTDNFNLPFTQATTTLNSIKVSDVFEIQDSIAINFLGGVARKAYTANAVACTGLINVNADSWTPSRKLVSCQSGSFAQPPCSDLSNLVVCPQGCYEIYVELATAAGDSANFQNHLNSRYGTGCNYASYVIELHKNWNLPRITMVNSVQGNLNTIKATVDNYDSSVKVIQASLNSFKSTLETNYNSETNLTSGSFNGVDCRVVGQSITEFRDSICVGLLRSIEYNYIVLAIISYAILFLSCFSVCAGVRHFQHLQKMQIKVGYKGVPVSISSNRIIDKFDT